MLYQAEKRRLVMINELMWRITYRCNKKCQYCFNEIFEDKVNHLCEEKIDIDYLERFVKKFGIKKVYVSGGEPAVIDNLEEVINKISSFATVVLFTNGLLFEKYDFQQIAEMPIDAVNTTIDLADIINFSKHFEVIMDKFKSVKLSNASMKMNVQIMIDKQYFDVVNSDGFKYMSSVVDRVLWQPLTVTEESLLYSTTLEGMDSKDAEKIIVDLKKRNQGEMFEHITNLSEVLGDLGGKSCLMGRKYITMNPDMSINICPHINDYVVTEEELEDIDKKSESFLCEKFSMRCFSLYSHLKRRFM